MTPNSARCCKILILHGDRRSGPTGSDADHVVIAVMETKHWSNHRSPNAPYINSLAAGALLTNSFALTHPSQPNYIALYPGRRA